MFVYIVLAIIAIPLIIFTVYTRILIRKSNTKGPGILSQGTSVFDVSGNWIKENKIHEGFMHMWLGPKMVVVAVDPDAAKFVLKCPDLVKTFIQPSKYFIDHFGQHLVSTNGDVWKKQRAVVNSAFSAKAYQSYFPIFSDMTDKVESIIERLAVNGLDVDVAGLMQRFTLDLLGNSVFHHDFGCLDGKFDEYYGVYKTLISTVFGNNILRFAPFYDYLPFEQVKRIHINVDKIYTLFHKLVDEHRKNKSQGDILDHMLAAADDPVTGLSTTELYSNMWVFFIAGHETTALALTTALYEMSTHQDIQSKIHQEITEVVGDQKLTLELVNKLEYLDCFMSENLRVHPPVTLLPNRLALKDIHYGDQCIPKGSLAGVHISAIHQNPKWWPEPDKFNPDRFLPENKKGRHHFAYTPFSLGPRMCIGNDFSLHEQRLLLTKLVQKYHILPPKMPPRWTNVGEVIKFGKPDATLALQFVPRK